MIMDKVSAIFPTLDRTDCDLNDMDRIYNRIARRQPAYISLMFPVIWIYIFVAETNKLGDNANVVKYIFNCIVAICVFLPALLFLYEQLIRGISEIVTESLLFKLINPVLVPFRHNCISLNKKDKEKIAEIANSHYKIEIDEIKGADKLRCNKELRNKLKVLVKFIRFSDPVKNSSIAFENNCVYGFFRNLVGGVVLDLLIYYGISLIGNPNTSNLMQSFYDISIPLLWSLFFVSLIFAWCYRVKQVKRDCNIIIGSYLKKNIDDEN